MFTKNSHDPQQQYRPVGRGHGKLSKMGWPCDDKSQTNDSQKITAKNTIRRNSPLLIMRVLHSDHSCLTHDDKCSKNNLQTGCVRVCYTICGCECLWLQHNTYGPYLREEDVFRVMCVGRFLFRNPVDTMATNDLSRSIDRCG